MGSGGEAWGEAVCYGRRVEAAAHPGAPEWLDLKKWGWKRSREWGWKRNAELETQNSEPQTLDPELEAVNPIPLLVDGLGETPSI